MENNKTNQNNNVAFENLKKLTSILNGNEINNFVGGIGRAKKLLDTYCRNLKDKEQLRQKQQEERKVVEATTPSFVEKTPRPHTKIAGRSSAPPSPGRHS